MLNLSHCRRGVSFNSVCYNHLIYADDTVLLAPSPKALQSLINECADFAVSHNLIFNMKKTKFLCIRPQNMKNLYVPEFVLGQARIRVVNEETYLGFILNESVTDDDHIVKEMRNLFVRGNMLIRKFVYCTEEVKIKLFKAFCLSMYCCPLWSNYRLYSIRRLHVAMNKVFKGLMRMPYFSSASLLFAVCNVPNFSVLRRKLVYSLRRRIYESCNKLVTNFTVFSTENVMHSKWDKLLFVSD